METTYFGLLPTYLLLISLKITTFLLLLCSNIGKVAELWTLQSSTDPICLSMGIKYSEEILEPPHDMTLNTHSPRWREFKSLSPAVIGSPTTEFALVLENSKVRNHGEGPY